MLDLLADVERIKYEKVWGHKSYRQIAVGERFPKVINKLLKLEQGKTLVDFGCGTGRPAKLIKDMGLNVIGIDHAYNCLDAGIDIDFRLACLWDLPEDITGDYGLCTDVLEHIPEEKIDAVLAGIKRAVPVCFITVEDEPDLAGPRIGEVLHMTVKPMNWWYNKLREHFRQVQGYTDKVFVVRVL